MTDRSFLKYMNTYQNYKNMKKQKVWLITGASRGFGLEIAKAALKAGDKVVATVRSNPEQFEQQFPEQQNLSVVVLDVTQEKQVIAGVEKAIATFGGIDVLVNNAGYGLLGATEEITDQEVRSQFDTNVFGLLNVTRAVLPYMRSRQKGHIINISSLFGYAATVPGFGLYGATKFAVEGITEGLQLEVKPFGIHVTAVAPGLFRTDFASGDSYKSSQLLLEEYQGTVGQVRQAVAGLHGNQPGDPAKLAQVILELANAEHPPLHLPVGKDAVSALQAKMSTIAKEVAEWETLSVSTDYQKN